MTLGEQLRAEGREQGMKEGMEQGMEQGMEKALLTIAKRLLLEGSDLSFIAKITELPLDKIIELQAS